MDARSGAFPVSVFVLGAAASVFAGCNEVWGLEETVVALPNFYTCDCQCSHRVVATQGGAVLAGPAMLPVRVVVPAGSQGEITS
jgi:hypothetical protein